MRQLSLALMIAALAAAPASAQEAPALCKALRALADEARTSGQPQRVSAGVDFAAPADCRPVTPSAAARSFCDVAAQESGLAWRIYGCVDTLAAGTQFTTRAEHAERRTRKAIAHLTAALAHGARLDLAEAGGRYDIVVWSPK